ncbi:FMN reductase [Streptomyces avicenniae]|uniref:FMN reductase n=1 Tax=Streptomyces avicenniae TaxID=500153 RepID=UPI000B001A0E|nr:FMN reductase [Streptomyces avicenniae]
MSTSMPAPRIVVVSAGLSQPSSTRLLADRLVEAVRRELAREGREPQVQVVELRELATDIAGHLVTGFPAPVLRQVIGDVTGADAVIAVTPVFAASYSGLFKSFFDLIEPDALAGKPVLMGATGGTARHSLVLDHAMRPLFSYLHATAVPTAVYAASEDWGGTGDPRTETLPRRVDRAARELAALLPGERVSPAPEHGAGESADAEEEPEVVPFAQQLAALRPR